jgi:malto-oligosyltrehalose trehalohydrolase
LAAGLDMPFGATLLPRGGVRFRLWAPGASDVTLRIESGGGGDRPMAPQADGWFEAVDPNAVPGTRYRYVIDGGAAVPDPASRFQPDDVHGASEVIDPGAYRWQAADWRGRPWHETVLYELHVGTFTPHGTYRSAIQKLDELVALGVRAIELMPPADFPGRRNWGYDGVLPFAPDAAYGRPNDLRALIDAAHARGLMVFIDVVYNHFGPDGNYLHLYAPDFFTERHHTPWGAAIDFERQRAVRDFFVANALYWLTEFRADGLRLDAVHAIKDNSPTDILTEMATRVRECMPEDRHIHLVLENDNNEVHRLRRAADGRTLLYDAQWNDDVHHALHVLLTGEAADHYVDYADAPAERLGRALAEGFAYQGEPSAHRGNTPRGEPSAALPPTAFVNFLQNHDQIGNRAFGERIDTLASAAAVAAATAIVLLGPAIPMLYMGEECGETNPFLFFCDFPEELAQAVRDGRRREFARFLRFLDEKEAARIPDPNHPATMTASRIDWTKGGRAPHVRKLDLVRSLLRIRHREIVPRLPGIPGGKAEYTVLGEKAVLVHWTLGDGSTLKLAANLAPAPVARVAGDLNGRILFESRDGARDSFANGTLPPHAAIFTLSPAVTDVA